MLVGEVWGAGPDLLSIVSTRFDLLLFGAVGPELKRALFSFNIVSLNILLYTIQQHQLCVSNFVSTWSSVHKLLAVY